MKLISCFLQIKGAQELGATAVLIYSDPRDDGFVTVENGFAPYPGGPARNPTSVQRGSVQFISSYPGDPTTPGYPSYENATREEATNIPKIPSLPISWQNAERLLEEIEELYSVGKDGKKILSGKASRSRVKLVNHGQRSEDLFLLILLIDNCSGYEGDPDLEYDGRYSWSYS